MIDLTVGLPGQGKSLRSAKMVLNLLERNKKWEAQTGVKRRIAANMPFSPELEAKYPGSIVYWSDIEEVCRLADVDVIFDEVANKFDARNWINLPDAVKWWLRHHDKEGVEIYANTQHYEAVDVQFRRLVNYLYVVTKVIGSGRPAATKPPAKMIWGVVMVRQHDPKTYSFEGDSGEKVRSTIGFPSFFFITRKLVSIYDTRHKILGDDETKMRHIVKSCDVCRAQKIVHV